MAVGAHSPRCIRRAVGGRAERRKRQANEPSRGNPKRSESATRRQGRDGQRGRARRRRDEDRRAAGAFRVAWEGNRGGDPKPNVRAHAREAEGDTQAERRSEETRDTHGEGQGGAAGDFAGSHAQGRPILLGIVVRVQAQPKRPAGDSQVPRAIQRRVRVGGRHRPGQILRQRAAGQAHVQGAPRGQRRDDRIADSQVPQGRVRHLGRA